MHLCYNVLQHNELATGVDLSNILGRQTQLWREQNVVKTDKCMGVPRFFWGRARTAHQSLRPCSWHYRGIKNSTHSFSPIKRHKLAVTSDPTPFACAPSM